MSSLEELNKKIKRFKREHAIELEEEQTLDMKGTENPAFRMAVELAASLAVGVLAGFLMDNHFGTKPIFILLGTFLGLIAGFYNFYRVAKGAGLAGLYPEEKPDQKPKE